MKKRDIDNYHSMLIERIDTIMQEKKQTQDLA